MYFRLLAVCMLFFITSCRSTRSVSSLAYLPNMSKSKVIKKYQANSFEQSAIKTVKINAKASYKIGNSSHRLGLKFRIAKGEKIWISADFLGIPVMKMLIERSKVSYYNKFNKTYFEGSSEFISQLIGIDVSYKVLENLFVGDLFLNISAKRFAKITKADVYFFKDLKITDFLTEVTLDPQNCKAKSQVIEHFLGKSLFAVYYNSHQKVDDFIFPKELTIKGVNKEKESVITMKYEDVSFNEELNFPYSVPKDCDQKIVFKSKNTKNINE